MILEVSAFVSAVQAKLKKSVDWHNKNFDSKISLTIVTTLHSPATDSYIKNKIKTGESLGINVEVLDLSKAHVKTITTLLERMENPTILQLPLRPDLVLYKDMLLNSIPKKWDVDGLGKNSEFTPATALGIYSFLTELEHFNKATSVCIIGRSNLVGKPLLNLLLKTNLTVSLIHSKTPKNVRKRLLGFNDVVVSAAGVPNLLEPDMVKVGATVIDVGMNRNEEGKLCGDCSSAFKEDKFRYVTPVPGGVGKLTTTYLMYNVLHAYGYV